MFVQLLSNERRIIGDYCSVEFHTKEEDGLTAVGYEQKNK